MNNLIPQPKLIELLCGTTKIDRGVAERFIEAFTALVSESLAANDSVKIKGFGQFRISRDDGAPKVTFSPEKEISDAINAPFACFEPVELAPGLTAEYLDESVREEMANDRLEEKSESDDLSRAEIEETPAEATAPPSAPQDAEINVTETFTEVIFEEETAAEAPTHFSAAALASQTHFADHSEEGKTAAEDNTAVEKKPIEEEPVKEKSANEETEGEETVGEETASEEPVAEEPEAEKPEVEEPEAEEPEAEKPAEKEPAAEKLSIEENPINRGGEVREAISLEDLPSEEESSMEAKISEKEIFFDDVPPFEGNPLNEVTDTEKETPGAEETPQPEDIDLAEKIRPIEDDSNIEEKSTEDGLLSIEEDTPNDEEITEEERGAESASLEQIYQSIKAGLNAMAQPNVAAKPQDTEEEPKENAPEPEPEKDTAPIAPPYPAVESVEEEPQFVYQPPVQEEPPFVPQPLEEEETQFVPQPSVQEEPPFVPQPPVEEETQFVPQPPVEEETQFVPQPPVEEEPQFVFQPLVEEDTPNEPNDDQPITPPHTDASEALQPVQKPQPKPWFWIAIAYVAGMVIGYALGFFGHDYVSGTQTKNASSNPAADQTSPIDATPAPELDLSDAEEGIVESPETDDYADPEETAEEETTQEETEPQPEEPATPQPSEPVYDTVRPGRFLSTMAKEHYGNKVYWVYIYLENQDKIKNPNNVVIGTQLRIPPKEKYDVSATDESANLKAANAKQAEIYKKYGN